MALPPRVPVPPALSLEPGWEHSPLGGPAALSLPSPREQDPKHWDKARLQQGAAQLGSRESWCSSQQQGSSPSIPCHSSQAVTQTEVGAFPVPNAGKKI